MNKNKKLKLNKQEKISKKKKPIKKVVEERILLVIHMSPKR